MSAVAASLQETTTSLQQLADEHLYRLSMLRNEAAFAILRERHIGRVRRAAASVLGDACESEDVAQEVMLIVWKQGAAFEQTTAKFATWLHRIAINKAIDFRRRARCVPSAQEDLTSALDAGHDANASSEQEDLAHKAQLHMALKGLLQRLPAAQRDVLTLFYFEEADVGAIASGLEISEQAVRSLLKRGKATLRAFLMLTDPSLSGTGLHGQDAEERVLAAAGRAG